MIQEMFYSDSFWYVEQGTVTTSRIEDYHTGSKCLLGRENDLLLAIKTCKTIIFAFRAKEDLSIILFVFKSYSHLFNIFVFVLVF